jgi:hypothetical protein
MKRTLLSLFLLTAACSSESPADVDSGTPGADTGTPPQNDAGTPPENDAGITPDAVAPSGIATFVAIGYEGRTTVSCDDGKTWIANKSDDDKVKCFAPLDCDHDGKAGRGIAFGNGWFVADFGWGQPGTVRRSRDGAVWETVLTGPNFASMMFGAGRFLGAARTGKLSQNDGMTWSDAAEAKLMSNGQDVWNVRRGAYVGTGFLLVADGPTAAFGKDGTSWSQLKNLPATCGTDIQWSGGIAYGNGAIVVVDGKGVACRSTDEGASWTTKNLGGGLESRLIFTGSEFIVWGAGVVYRSQDGTTWTSTPTKKTVNGNPAGAGPNIGPVARSPQGTYVAVNGGWDQWYDKQRFYRSADGITWDELPTSSFVGSHPMTHITWGAATTSTVCAKK